ncbi:MAG: CBS domain-containing protein [Streptosporangiales bacterium]|nr:CBS domain-containing protein [Streptosporangiales bacterium]
MHVSDIMTEASITDTPSDTLRAAAERMWAQQTGSLLVMDNGRLVGIITERDLLRAVARGIDLDTTRIRDVMTTDLVTAWPDSPLRDAAREMAHRWIRHLPVVEGDRIVGVVSMRDVTGVFAALSKDPEEIQLDLDELVRERRLVRIEQGDLD